MFKSRSLPSSRWLLCLLYLLPSTLSAQSFSVERLNGGEPILTASHFQAVGAPAREGENINGPSVIRIPDWIPPAQRADSSARYYLYFAHHSGDYIRLAWARDVEGPWQLYRTGKGIEPGNRGVLDMGSDRLIALGNGLAITSHIASPDVHVDDDQKRITMYFHGVTRRDDTRFKAQQTYVATSPTGLDFSAGLVPYPLSGSYLRVFAYQGELQGLTPKKFHRPRNSNAPWEVPADLAQVELGLWAGHNTRFLAFRADATTAEAGRRAPAPRSRHLGLYPTGDNLHVFFTMKKHAPERILATTVDLTVDDWFNAAAAGAPEEILRPEREWEGATLNPQPSKKGAAVQAENALRDPFVFSDEGKLYLFYAGGGEQAIGLARLTPQHTGE
jgi:hypothetical protein